MNNEFEFELPFRPRGRERERTVCKKVRIRTPFPHCGERGEESAQERGWGRGSRSRVGHARPLSPCTRVNVLPTRSPSPANAPVPSSAPNNS